MNGMVNGNVEMRNMMAEHFLNRPPMISQGIHANGSNGMNNGMNMMVPYYPTHQHNAFNNYSNDYGCDGMFDMVKKSKKKKKRKKYYSSSEDSSSDEDDNKNSKKTKN